jgi:hypothetical protein
MNKQDLQPKNYLQKSHAQPTIAMALSRLARPAALITLGIGMYLHFTRLFIGTELLIKYIYTATFDTVFSIPMLVGLVSFLPAWKRMVFRNKFEKVVVVATGLLLLLSVPLHVQTWYSQSTNYILVFPMAYSIIFLAYSSVMVFVWTRLKIVTES